MLVGQSPQNDLFCLKNVRGVRVTIKVWKLILAIEELVISDDTEIQASIVVASVVK